MTYAVGGQIEASDYNILVWGAMRAQPGTTGSIGKGLISLGLDASGVFPVQAGNQVSAAKWQALVSAVNTLLTHYGQPTISIPITAGAPVTYYSALQNAIGTTLIPFLTAFTFNLTTGYSTNSLRDLAIAAGWNQTQKVIATAISNIGFNDVTSSTGLVIDGSFPNGVELVINPGVYLTGGAGSSGAGGSYWVGEIGGQATYVVNAGGAGGPGGTALEAYVPVTITNNGIIGGGGGGGGGGAGLYILYNSVYSGESGGMGAGFNNNYVVATLGSNNMPNAPNGGNGGALGQQGMQGQNGSDGSYGIPAGGAGGLPGKAILGAYNVTWVNQGTIIGAQLSSPPVVEYLIAAGGGASGSVLATDTNGSTGGGGAGGVLTSAYYTPAAGTTVSIVVGAKGAEQTNVRSVGNSGANSAIGSLVAIGGGGGGWIGDWTIGSVAGSATNGGSGGGGAYNPYGPYTNGIGTGTTGQGHSGGGAVSINGGWPNYTPLRIGGGGGGAGGPGGNTIYLPEGGLTPQTIATYGQGGIGISSSITGSPVTYGVGSSAAGYVPGGLQPGFNGPPVSVTQNGTVIIKYPKVYRDLQNVTGSPTITVLNGYKIYQWTTPGTWSATF